MAVYTPPSILFTAAATCATCQESILTSTLRVGRVACPGEEVTFTCTVRDSSTLPVLQLTWSSDEYIGSGDLLQFTTNNSPGTSDSRMINGNVTAILTNNTIINGVRLLVSTLHIVAVQASMLTCRVTNRAPVSVGFSISGMYIVINIGIGI